MYSILFISRSNLERRIFLSELEDHKFVRCERKNVNKDYVEKCKYEDCFEDRFSRAFMLILLFNEAQVNSKLWDRALIVLRNSLLLKITDPPMVVLLDCLTIY